MNKNTFVSICVPNYNSEIYLRDCLNSLVKQTYDNYEIIVVDNASTDKSWKIINEFQKRYPNLFRIYRNKKNIGMTANWNKCIKYAKGRYIAIYHSDDVYHPQIVEFETYLLNKYKLCRVVGTDIKNINEKYTYSKKDFQQYREVEIFFELFKFNSRIKNFIKILSIEPYLNAPTFMFRKEIFREIGFFDKSFEIMEDLEFFYRIGYMYTTSNGYLHLPLVLYRHKNKDKSYTEIFLKEFNLLIKKREEYYKNLFKISSNIYELKLLEECYNRKTILDELNLIRFYRIQGNFDMAKKHINKTKNKFGVYNRLFSIENVNWLITIILVKLKIKYNYCRSPIYLKLINYLRKFLLKP